MKKKRKNSHTIVYFFSNYKNRDWGHHTKFDKFIYASSIPCEVVFRLFVCGSRLRDTVLSNKPLATNVFTLKKHVLLKMQFLFFLFPAVLLLIFLPPSRIKTDSSNDLLWPSVNNLAAVSVATHCHKQSRDQSNFLQPFSWNQYYM